MSPRAAPWRFIPMRSPKPSPAKGRSASNGKRTSAGSALTPLDTILVAVGGGGLIAGVAAWFDGRVKVVGVEPEGSCALHAALAAGRPVDVAVQIGGGRFARRAQRRRAQSRDRSTRGRSRRAGERRGDPRRPARRSGAISRSSPSPAARRPTRRWRAAPTARPPGERVGVLVCGANADLAALAAAAAGLGCCDTAKPRTMVRAASRTPAPAFAPRWGVAKW